MSFSISLPCDPNAIYECYPDACAYDPADDYKPVSSQWLETLRAEVANKRCGAANSQPAPERAGQLHLIRGVAHSEKYKDNLTPLLRSVPMASDASARTIFHFGVRCIEKAVKSNDGTLTRPEITAAMRCLNELTH